MSIFNLTELVSPALPNDKMICREISNLKIGTKVVGLPKLQTRQVEAKSANVSQDIKIV